MEYEEGVRVLIKSINGKKFVKGKIKIWDGPVYSNFISYGEDFKKGRWMGSSDFILDESYYREKRLNKLLDGKV